MTCIGSSADVVHRARTSERKHGLGDARMTNSSDRTRMRRRSSRRMCRRRLNGTPSIQENNRTSAAAAGVEIMGCRFALVVVGFCVIFCLICSCCLLRRGHGDIRWMNIVQCVQDRSHLASLSLHVFGLGSFLPLFDGWSLAL